MNPYLSDPDVTLYCGDALEARLAEAERGKAEYIKANQLSHRAEAAERRVEALEAALREIAERETVDTPVALPDNQGGGMGTRAVTSEIGLIARRALPSESETP